MSLICHLRAAFADPGLIPKGIIVPDYVDTVTLNTCEKGECKELWKPQRAHHCSECETCIFKVSIAKSFPLQNIKNVLIDCIFI